MKLHLGKRELVAMFMESPFYFDLRVRERLALLRDHIRRFSLRAPQAGLTVLTRFGKVDPAAHVATFSQGAEA
jgi:hypothetical protein